jgi:TolB protein
VPAAEPTRRIAAVAGVLATLVLVPAPGADAVYPGRNGLIAVVASAPQSGGGTRQIHLIRPDGTRVRRIPCPTTCADLWPVWSPGGRRLAFNAEIDPGPAGMRVGVVRADGSGRRILPAPTPSVSAVAPAWTPDHARIAFGAVGFEAAGIWTSDLRGGDVRRLSPSGDQPACSVDGMIAYSAGGPPEIWSMNADGSGRRRLSDGAGQALYPEWSPRGRRIAYTRVAGGHESIWVMRADGGNQHRVTAGAAPAWSPNGRWIAFERSNRLYVMRTDGRAIRRIPYTPETGDGRRLRLSLPDWQATPTGRPDR